jgi:hypothetical protein
MNAQLSTMTAAVAGLFDYAGMFPPADLNLRATVQRYLEYRHGRHAWALGCLVIRASDLSALQEEAREEMRELRLSVVATGGDEESIQQHLDEGLPIEMIETKAADGNELLRMRMNHSAGIATYVEVPVGLRDFGILDGIREAGMHAKLRMGGIVAEAFPDSASVAAVLKALVERRIAFKATAGLHHPLRSRHPYTYQKDSKTGVMHGFVNLLCASALAWFGGAVGETAQLLEEQDPHAWQVTDDAVRWRSWEWSADELHEVREHFLVSIGTCSFTEPMDGLEALGWL